MSLGNFTLGTTVRIPLQITESGGIPITDATSVKIQKIIKPDLAGDSNFPQTMIALDVSYGLYYIDYKPKSLGNYIVIYSIIIDSIEYTQMDSFFISEVVQSSPPRAKAVSFRNSSAKAV